MGSNPIRAIAVRVINSQSLIPMQSNKPTRQELIQTRLHSLAKAKKYDIVEFSVDNSRGVATIYRPSKYYRNPHKVQWDYTKGTARSTSRRRFRIHRAHNLDDVLDLLDVLVRN